MEACLHQPLPFDTDPADTIKAQQQLQGVSATRADPRTTLAAFQHMSRVPKPQPTYIRTFRASQVPRLCRLPDPKAYSAFTVGLAQCCQE